MRPTTTAMPTKIFFSSDQSLNSTTASLSDNDGSANGAFGSTRSDEDLLFPSDRGKGMIRDLRKALDAIGRSAGWEAGEVRTRMFRHTYCATRLQTLDRGAPVSPWVVSREMGHGGRSLVDRVYGHLGDVRHRSETVEFRVEQHREQLAERAQKVADLSL